QEHFICLSFILIHFSFMFLRPSISPHFPYTTLFRSPAHSPSGARRETPGRDRIAWESDVGDHGGVLARAAHRCQSGGRQPKPSRSEEHTSELQSRENLVCRLLLEKKKKT